MNPKIKNLLIRTVSGGIYIALMISGTFYSPIMTVLLCLFACVGLHEFFEMASGPNDKHSKIAVLVVTIGLFLLLFHQSTQLLNYFIYLLIGFLLLATYLGSMEIFRHRPCPIEHIGTALWGFCWITAPLYLITMFNNICAPSVLALFILIWSYDTFAYLGGSMYGKRKLCERISPKKTWEGALTGFVAVLAIAFFFPSVPFFKQLLAEHYAWMIFAVFVVVFGTIGDLLESIFKRNAGIKDSGKFLPGHGGILDRIDSLLLASVPTLLYLLFSLMI